MYRRLEIPSLASGLLLRRTSQPDVIDAWGKIRPDQLSDPTEDIARHFSVNLLGNFQLADLPWGINRSVVRERKAEFYAPWEPGQQGLLPTSEEAECLPVTEWGYCWLPLQEINGCRFISGEETFVCLACHAPTRCNYWHFELHFHNEQGDVYNLGPSQRKKVARKIRAWLQDYVLTQPPEILPVIPPWPEDVYKTDGAIMPAT